LPLLQPPGSAAWAWDLPNGVAQTMLANVGGQKKTFYCPSTSPRFSDYQNFEEPGLGNSLWNFDSSTSIAGYVFALSGSSSLLYPTNQNTKLADQTLTIKGITFRTGPTTDRVLTADVVISTGDTLPGYSHPGNNYTKVSGGFPHPRVGTYPHLSAHLKNVIPQGQNLGFEDGHVQWHKFDATVINRVGSNQPYFWW
jgi:hypothetical protein